MFRDAVSLCWCLWYKTYHPKAAEEELRAINSYFQSNYLQKFLDLVKYLFDLHICSTDYVFQLCHFHCLSILSDMMVT